MLNSIIMPLTTSGNAGNQTGAMGMLTMFIPLIGIVALMYFMMIRPQKKKEKKDAEMRNNIQIGDEVVTVGGVVGIVFSIKDDTIVIETGSDRSKIRIKKIAIATNQTIHEEEAK